MKVKRKRQRTPWHRELAEAWPYLSKRDRLDLLDPKCGRVEPIVLDALVAAPRRGLSAAEIVASADGAVSHPAVRVVLKLYTASGTCEVAGVGHCFSPLGRRASRYRLTRKGRAHARMLAGQYEKMIREAAA